MRESLIQTSIITTLEKKGWMVVKIIQCNKNGWPDLMALRQGRTVFIEVKQPGKRPTDLQKYRHEKLRQKGFDVITATSVNDVQNFFALTC